MTYCEKTLARMSQSRFDRAMAEARRIAVAWRCDLSAPLVLLADKKLRLEGGAE